MIQMLLIIIYISFVSLGLPDAVLGAAWPIMRQGFQVPVSAMGAIALTISTGTVVSSLLSDRLTRKFGAGLVTAVSVATTADDLLGFCSGSSYWMLVLWAIHYGLGAGSVDACLNNYVAVHYASRHMSWLHCMWGIGASAGPYVMSMVLSGGMSWNMGYITLGVFQVLLSAVLFATLPLWKSKETTAQEKTDKPLSLGQVLRISGVIEIIIMFFCYCALEQTVGQWASSYLVLHHNLTEQTAAGFASLFYAGMTIGRLISGFLTIRFDDKTMIRFGSGVVGVGLLIMLMPIGNTSALIGLSLIGLGCAPIYPCVIHSTPGHFGADKSQAVIGVQMASAYVGVCVVPPLFGILADALGIWLLPVIMLLILAVMVVSHEKLIR